MEIEPKSKAIEQRREAVRNRVQKYRERLRLKKLNDENAEVPETPTNRLDGIVGTRYTCVQTLGRAVKKVTRVLPVSPTKKKAILAKIVVDLDETDRDELTNAITKSNKKPSKKQYTPNLELIEARIEDIHQFYERDDISRVSPKMKDVKQYTCPETDERVLRPTRHMVLTVRESYSMFMQERNDGGEGLYDFQCYFIDSHSSIA